MQMWKGLGRWLIRLKAYGNCGSTWLGDLQVLLPVLYAAGTADVTTAIVLALFMYGARVVAGWMDLHLIHATDYLMEFQGSKAAARVKVVR